MAFSAPTGSTAEEKEAEELSTVQGDDTNDHSSILAAAEELFIG